MIVANFDVHDGDNIGKLKLMQQQDKQLLLQNEPSNNSKCSILTYPNPNTVLRMNMANDGIGYGLYV